MEAMGTCDSHGEDPCRRPADVVPPPFDTWLERENLQFPEGRDRAQQRADQYTSGRSPVEPTRDTTPSYAGPHLGDVPKSSREDVVRRAMVAYQVTRRMPAGNLVDVLA